MSSVDSVGIAEMARLSGLSQDTLRWYEKEGVLPSIGRGPDGRRRYASRDRDLVLLLVALRRAGMPTAEMKDFVALLSEGAASHGRRLAMLAENRRRLQAQRAAIDRAVSALDVKAEHYRSLIARGLDCDGRPITDDQVRARQQLSMPDQGHDGQLGQTA